MGSRDEDTPCSLWPLGSLRWSVLHGRDLVPCRMLPHGRLVLLREQLAVCCNTCWLLRWKSGRAGRLLPNRRDPAAAPERELGEVLRQRAKRGGEPQAGLGILGSKALKGQ